MAKVGFSLAELVIATAERQGRSSHFAALATVLKGTGYDAESLPAKRYELDDRFVMATTKVCDLPKSEIATALPQIQLRFPKLWLECEVPGNSGLRMGSLYTKSGDRIVMSLVLEHSAALWKQLRGPLPEKSCVRSDRALFEAPISMRFGDEGIEIYSDEASVGVPFAQALYSVQRHPFQNEHVRETIERDIRNNYTAGDFMMRALVLMGSPKVVTPEALADIAAEQEQRRREFANRRQRQQRGNGGAIIPAPCTRYVYDITAVKAIAAAKTIGQVRALLRPIEIVLPESQPWVSRKTGLPMMRKDGTPITHPQRRIKYHVRADYFERREKATATRPIKLEVNGGKPVVLIGPK